MYKLLQLLAICIAFSSGSKHPVPDKGDEKIVGCYYSINLEGDDPEPELEIGDIDVSLCTHLFYSFVGIDTNATVGSYDPYADLDSEGFKRFNELRKKNPQLKTLAAIADFSDPRDQETTNIEILTNLAIREDLINNMVTFVKTHNFNGIDIKFTDSPKRGGRSSDKKDLVSFLKALREKFDKEHLILSATVNPNEAVAKIFYDIKGISKYVDFINLRTIEFHECSNEEKNVGVGHSSPLYPSSKESGEERKKNIDYVVKYWIAQGAPPNKLILGIPFNGISYLLADPKKFGRGAPFTKEGHYYAQTGYASIFGMIPHWNRIYDKEQQVPYIYKDHELIAYDDVESITKKAEYAEKMKLGGVVVWNIDDDDFEGALGKKFPLLRAINEVLRNKK